MEKSILFQPTGEVRKAESLEWVYDGDSFWPNTDHSPTVFEYPIYTRHELPEEVAQRMMEEAKP